MAEVKLKEETELWDPAEHNNSVEPPHIKEEPELCIKQEPEEFPFHMVCVKTEDDEDKSSVLHQRATEENREETNGEDCGAEAGCSSDPLTQLHSDSEEHTDSSSDTDHSEDYSQEQAPSKRSYAMISPDSSVTDVKPYSLDKKKRCSVQDALAVIHGDDSEFEGCDSGSDEDPEGPEYTASTRDMENELSESDSDRREAELEAPCPDINPEQQNTTDQEDTKFYWTKKLFEAPECTFKGPSVTPPDRLHTPLEYFRKFITTQMLELLKDQTNVYSVQTSAQHSSVHTTVKELEVLVGLYLRMGLCQLPGSRAYWEHVTRCAMVADHMSHQRFRTLLAALHFTDNTDSSHQMQEDKCWKIRPWLDMFRKQCLEITPEEHNSVGELTVSFRGTRSPGRRCVKGRPHPWGVKMWGRCTSSGILCDFVVCEGGAGRKTLLGPGGDAVVKLCKTLPSNQNYKVSADTLCTSASLVHELLQRHVYFVGTIRSSRMAGVQLEDEKSLAKRGKGSADARVEKEEHMTIVRWYDSRSVTLISSYCGAEPRDKARRWSRSDKAFVEVNRPHILKEYSAFMGGVDLLDACVAKYKQHMRSRRWYLYLFWQTVMLGLVNAWLTYRRDCELLGVHKPLKQRSFQAEVATSLILLHSHRGHPSLCPFTLPPPPKRVRAGVPDDVRADQVAHWPVKCDKRGRCKFCKINATTTLCEKCDVRLCFTEERNCFRSFHVA